MVKIERKRIVNGKKTSTVHVISYGNEDVAEVRVPSWLARQRAESFYQKHLKTADC